jgi:hypothetical protein
MLNIQIKFFDMGDIAVRCKPAYPCVFSFAWLPERIDERIPLIWPNTIKVVGIAVERQGKEGVYAPCELNIYDGTCHSFSLADNSSVEWSSLSLILEPGVHGNACMVEDTLTRARQWWDQVLVRFPDMYNNSEGRWTSLSPVEVLALYAERGLFDAQCDAETIVMTAG